MQLNGYIKLNKITGMSMRVAVKAKGEPSTGSPFVFSKFFSHSPLLFQQPCCMLCAVVVRKTKEINARWQGLYVQVIISSFQGISSNLLALKVVQV
jgi:hypothetical protein